MIHNEAGLPDLFFVNVSAILKHPFSTTANSTTKSEHQLPLSPFAEGLKVCMF